MKSIIKFAGLFFIFSCTFLIMSNVQQVSARSDELEEALSNSMRNTLKASNINSAYEMDERDMQIEFIRYLVNDLSSDGDFEVQIMSVSKEGLLDVLLKTEFLHNNGKEGERSVRKTLLLEETKNK